MWVWQCHRRHTCSLVLRPPFYLKTIFQVNPTAMGVVTGRFGIPARCVVLLRHQILSEEMVSQSFSALISCFIPDLRTDTRKRKDFRGEISRKEMNFGKWVGKINQQSVGRARQWEPWAWHANLWHSWLSYTQCPWREVGGGTQLHILAPQHSRGMAVPREEHHSLATPP